MPVLYDTFWRHFKKLPSGCWKWTKACLPDKNGQPGYGSVFDPTRGCQRGVHVVAFEKYYKTQLKKGEIVQHSCDYKPCGNPKHLTRGTAKTNYADAKTKGRNTRGEKVWTSRLTAPQVAAIKTLLKQSIPLQRLAEVTGMSRCTVGDIGAGRTWRHVEAGIVPRRLRTAIERAVKRCVCGCGRVVTRTKYGYAWACPRRPSQYDLQASDPTTYVVCSDCGLEMPRFARGLCRKCYLSERN